VLLSTVCLVTAERHRHDVMRMLRVLRGHAAAKAGCLEFRLSQDLTDPNVLTVTERWATRADMDAHIRSTDYRLMLAVIDLSTAPPQIRFDVTEPIGGLDLVWAMREGRQAELGKKMEEAAQAAKGGN
jgi:quinol monooxygenase YgiN